MRMKQAWKCIQGIHRAALSLNPPHKDLPFGYNSALNSLGFWAGHGRSLRAPPVVLRPLSGHPSLWEGPEDPSRGRGTRVPSSRSGPGPRCPGLPHSCLSPVTCQWKRVEWGGGWEWRGIWARKRMAGPDALSPEPSQALVLYLPPRLSMGASRWMGSFVLRQWGWICLSEQASRRASAQQNAAWMRTRPVPGEHPECTLSQVRGDWPHFQGESREGS